MAYLIATLITFRLTVLVVRDEVSAPLRRRAQAVPFLRDLVTCHYCASVWLGWLVASLFHRGWAAIPFGFAYSGGALLLIALLDRLEGGGEAE